MTYRLQPRFLLGFCALMLAPLGNGCAKVAGSALGTGGTTGVITGAGGNGGTGSGNHGVGGGGVVPDAGGGTCQQVPFNFVPKTPTVYVVVDRSGSMFDCLSTPGNVEPSCPTASDTSWSKLKDATEMVISALDTQVRFGFAAFMGTNPMAGGTCPIISKVAPKLDNSTDIKTLYDSLPFPPNSTQSGVKFETPASDTITMIGTELSQDTTPGDKYILFVTDGQPDYCDDSNSLCAPDSVIAALQAQKKTNAVSTIVIGLQTSNFDLPAGILQAFANAGAGEPTVAPLRAGAADTFAFFDQCNSVAGWHADLVASKQAQVRGVTLGTYSTTAGPTKPYTPTATDQTMLVSQLSAALSGVKSCTFDLNNVNGTGSSIKVDTTQLNKAQVLVCEKADPASGVCPTGTMSVPLDNNNGWRINCVPLGDPACKPTQLELTGSACANWRSPNNTHIDLDFPCGVIVPG
jgi:hypothetical protein